MYTLATATTLGDAYASQAVYAVWYGPGDSEYGKLATAEEAAAKLEELNELSVNGPIVWFRFESPSVSQSGYVSANLDKVSAADKAIMEKEVAELNTWVVKNMARKSWYKNWKVLVPIGVGGAALAWLLLRKKKGKRQ